MTKGLLTISEWIQVTDLNNHLNNLYRRGLVRFNKPYIVGRLDSDGKRGFFNTQGDPHEIISAYSSPTSHTKHYAGTAIEGQMCKPGSRGSGSFYGSVPTTRFRRKHSERLIRSAKVVGVMQPDDETALVQIRNSFLEELKAQGLEATLNEPAEPTYLDVTPEDIESLQDEALKQAVQSGALDPNKMIYVRTYMYAGEKRNELGELLPGLGVGSVGHQKVLEVICINVGPYLGEGVNPAILVYPEAVTLADGKHKISANYHTLKKGKDMALKMGFHEAVFFGQKDDESRNPVLEGGGEALFYSDGKQWHTTPIELGVLPSHNRQHLIEIMSAIGIPVREDTPVRIQEYLNMPRHMMVGTWAELVTPEVFAYPIFRVAGIYKPDTHAEEVQFLKKAFIASINGCRTGESGIDKLTEREITPLEFLAQEVQKGR